MGKSMEAWHSTPSEGSVRREAPGCCGKKNGIGVTHHDRVLNYSCTLESRWLASILAISNPLEIYICSVDYRKSWPDFYPNAVRTSYRNVRW